MVHQTSSHLLRSQIGIPRKANSKNRKVETSQSSPEVCASRLPKILTSSGRIGDKYSSCRHSRRENCTPEKDMPANTDNQNTTNGRDTKDQNTPKNPIRPIWRTLRQSGYKRPDPKNTPTTDLTGTMEAESAPAASVSSSVVPSLQNIPSASEAVRIEALVTTHGSLTCKVCFTRLTCQRPRVV